MRFKDKSQPILPNRAIAPVKVNKHGKHKSKGNDNDNDEIDMAEDDDYEYEDDTMGLRESEKEFDHTYKGSMGLAVMNLSGRILITVLIAVPYAFKEAGFGLGVIMIILIGFLSDYTLTLLIQAAETTGENTYVGLVRKVFGKWGVLGVVFKQFLYPFLLMIASNVLITDILVKLIILIAKESDISGIADDFYGKRAFIIGTITLVVTLPLSLYKNFGYLAKWSACSLLLTLTLMAFVITRFATLKLPETPYAYAFATIDVGRAIGILIAGFMAQHSSFLIFDAMIQPTQARQLEATHISMSVALLSSLIFGVLGYATFTENTQANLLNNYCTGDILMTVGRVLFVISILLSFPGEVIVARAVIERTAFHSDKVPMWRHVLVTLVIVLASVGFSLLTDCLSIILELNGVTNAAPLAFVLPPLITLKLEKNQKGCTCRKFFLYLILIMGVSVTVFGIGLSVKSIIEGVECNHGEEPAFCNAGGGTTMLRSITLPSIGM